MKRIITSLVVLTMVASAANAQVLINEILSNPPGNDSTSSTGNEYFELRGTPNMSLSGYYLISLEGQAGTTVPSVARGDVNQFFDLGGPLGTYTIGANGYFFARQNFSAYTATAVGATVIQNAGGSSWGTTAASTIGHNAENTSPDLENSATTILLVNRGIGVAPTLALDMDSNDDGQLDLPSGWTVLDSVGIMDGVGPLTTDWSYGAITLRAGGVGSSWYNNIIDVPAGTGTGFYVGRIGESTGSTGADWLGAIVSGTGTDSLNMTFASTSDPDFQGLKLPDMVFGGPNPIPEPGTLALLGLGGLALFLRRKR